MAREGQLQGLISSDAFNNFECSHCIMGKGKRQPSPSNPSKRAGSPLERLHCDIWGPARNPSVGGRRYFLTIVEDYTASKNLEKARKMVDLDSLESKAEPKANSDSKAKLDDALERFLDGARALVEQQNASLTPLFDLIHLSLG